MSPATSTAIRAQRNNGTDSPIGPPAHECAFRLCFQIVLIAGSIDNNAPGFIRESCAAALFAARVVVDVILFSRLIAVDRRRNRSILYGRRSKWKAREKIWTGRCSSGERARREGQRASPLGASLDYFAMVQSTPSDLYFRDRSAKADRPAGINSTGQVLQFPRKRDNARPRCFVTTGCDCRAIKVDSLQMNWKAPAGNSLALLVNGMCICTGTRTRLFLSSIAPSLSNSSPLTLSA